MHSITIAIDYKYGRKDMMGIDNIILYREYKSKTKLITILPL